MTREVLDRLLAGYATGQLSEAERKQLMDAALEDQAVFDALAAEEPLRELLADPVARMEILDSLPPLKDRQAAWWRAPWTWALAGSLAAGLVVGVLLWQRRPQPVLVAVRQPAVEQPLATPAPAAPAPLPEKIQPPEEKLVRRNEKRASADVKEVPPPVAFRSDSVPESRTRSNAMGGVVGGVVGGAVAQQAVPPPPPLPGAPAVAGPARQEVAKAAEADAVASTNAPMKDERSALKASAEGFLAKKAPVVTAFIELPDGTRTRLIPGATVDRGAVVVLEVEGPLQILQAGAPVAETIPPGLKRTVRLATDKPGEQRYTLVTPDIPGASPRAAAFTARDSAEKSAIPTGRKPPEIFFVVR